MADIQQLSYPYFTDNSTALDASNLNPIIAKINELVVKVNGGSPTPTPTPTVSTPTITISGTSATITCATSGVTIYYTTNGDTPTSSSTQYSSAISMIGIGTLKAIAIKDGTSSNVASKKYPVNLFDVYKMTVGASISSANGTLVASLNLITSDYIPVTAGAQYTFKSRWIVVWFDSSKQFLSASPSSESSTRTLTTPTGAAYCRFSFDKTGWIAKEMIMNIGAVLGSDMDANQSYPPEYPNLLIADTVSASTGLDASNGNTISDLNSYQTSDYIAVTAGKNYTFYMRHNVCWYNSSKQFISGSAGASGGNTVKTLTAVSNAAYMRVSWETNTPQPANQIINEGTVLVLS